MTADAIEMNLNQGDYWVDIAGHRWKLEEMAPSHRRNVLLMLRRNAAAIELRDAIACLDSIPAVRGELAQEAEAEYHDWRGTHPDEWLESTPLVRRLVELEQT